MTSKPRIRQDEQQPPDQDRPLINIPNLVSAVKSAILRPIQPFVSRTALRAYLTTFLLLSATLILLAFATAAYSLFYWFYIPRIGFERTIHLQFDHVYKSHAATKRLEHPYPYGSVALAPDLVSMQGYDVVIELDMPRTRENRDAGNFMLEVAMYAQDTTASARSPVDVVGRAITPSTTSLNPDKVLAFSRRHAIVPYRSWAVDYMHTWSRLPWYFFNLQSETDKLRVPVFEKVAFPKGKHHLPATLHLEVQSTHRLQIYSAIAHFRARFTGLRWIMYNHRIMSAFVFIALFWFTELVFFGMAWGAVSFYLSSALPETIKDEDDTVTIKREHEGDSEVALSETERTFPTLAGQAPVRYTSPSSRIKQEEKEDHILPSVTPAMEADDEDEDEDEPVDFLDSGLGTSLESSNPSRRDSIRRRRARLAGRANDDPKTY